jgi:hypothetical protein
MQRNKYPSSFECYRHMEGMLTMWRKYLEPHAEARMFLSMLQPDRSSCDNVRMFLRIRKSILRTIGPKLMQEIKLTHCNKFVMQKM